MAAQPTSGINAKHGLYFGYTNGACGLKLLISEVGTASA